MCFKQVIIVLVFLVTISTGYSFIHENDSLLTLLTEQLNKWAAEDPVEKVYLQLDKPYYAAGDDIWFKAYVVSGGSHRLAAVSGVVTIDLVDLKDSIKQSIKLKLASGTAYGDFALPDTLSGGNYRIRAYTNYMRNAGSAYFFNKVVSIINTFKPAMQLPVNAIPGNKNYINSDVQFFPEGGYLVYGLTSKIAFKAVSPDGYGTVIKGIVTDNLGNQISVLNSTRLGMGEFELTPVKGKTYRAMITFLNGSERVIALPEAHDDGYVLSISSQDEDKINVKISALKDLPNKDLKQQPLLIAQSAGKIAFSARVNTAQGIYNVTIPKSSFSTGIVQFTLFSSAGEPLNERLVFINNKDQLKLNISPDKFNYSTGQKVTLNISALDINHLPVPGSFSVAVTDETKVPVNEAAENNILANLLLTSDLKGYIEEPAAYFMNPDSKKYADPDLLMLTQGYHRFEWKQLLNNSYPPLKYQPENSLQLSGTVLTTGGKPVVNGKVKLFDLDSIRFTRDTVTDVNGRFAFKNLTFDDSIRFIVQARNAKNKRDVVIKMDKVYPSYDTINHHNYYFKPDSSLSVYAQNEKLFFSEQRKYGLGNHINSLQEVFIRDKKLAVKHSANLNGAGNADQIIQAKDFDFNSCIRIADCLQGRITGVIFRNGIPYSTRDFRPMQVIIDGAYVDGEYLNSINYNDVEVIEILRNGGLTAIYGSFGGSGVFLITTKQGDENDYPKPVFGRGITTYYPKGYYKAREFYSPVYNEPKRKELADVRTTIFWKPDLTTNADGKASVNFFNAGSKGTYRVVIEGIGDDGHIGRQVLRYKVE